jgi:hypothetical protein
MFDISGGSLLSHPSKIIRPLFLSLFSRYVYSEFVLSDSCEEKPNISLVQGIFKSVLYCQSSSKYCLVAATLIKTICCSARREKMREQI